MPHTLIFRRTVALPNLKTLNRDAYLNLRFKSSHCARVRQLFYRRSLRRRHPAASFFNANQTGQGNRFPIPVHTPSDASPTKNFKKKSASYPHHHPTTTTPSNSSTGLSRIASSAPPIDDCAICTRVGAPGSTIVWSASGRGQPDRCAFPVCSRQWLEPDRPSRDAESSATKQQF